MNKEQKPTEYWKTVRCKVKMFVHSTNIPHFLPSIGHEASTQRDD